MKDLTKTSLYEYYWLGEHTLEHLIGLVVFRKRVEQGISQVELADKAGVSIGSVTRIEGGSKVNTLQLERVLDAVNVTEQEFTEHLFNHTMKMLKKVHEVARELDSAYCSLLNDNEDDVIEVQRYEILMNLLVDTEEYLKNPGLYRGRYNSECT